MKIQIDILNEHIINIENEQLIKLAESIWLNEGKKNAKISIIFVNDLYLAKLNKDYLQKDNLTDVIAFPFSENENDLFEGEIYISVDRVIENASNYQVEMDVELKRMVSHGMLHFLGYEDKSVQGKKNMTDRENYYLT